MSDSDDVVLDLEMLATLFYGLNSEPDLFHVLQFITIAEASILRDNLLVVAAQEASDHEHQEWREETDLVQAFMQPLFVSGASRIQTIELPSEGELPGSVRSALDGSKEVRSFDAEQDPVANVAVMAGRSLKAERKLGIPSLTLPMQQMFYEMSANVRGDHSVCDLTGHYASLAKALDDLRRSASVRPRAYDTVPLPPIGLQVLRRASSVDELSTAVLEVREAFSDLRKRLSDLKELLNDPDLPLRRKLKLRDRWLNAWKRLHSKYEFTSSMNLANTNNAIYRLAPEIPGAMSLNPGSWTKLLAAAVESGPALWSRWRMRPLHRAMRDYVAAPDRELGDAIARLICRPITADEVREVREVQDLIMDLGRSAVAIFTEDA